MVLADPVACRHRSSISNQYAEVGTKARPMHDKDKISKHAADVGLRPMWSDTGPQNIGASWMWCETA